MMMKNVFLICFMSLSLNAFSQLGRQQWLIGGNLSYSYEKASEINYSAVQLSPGIGYFFIDRLAGGIRLGFDEETYRYSPGDDRRRNTAVVVNPFLRYYFLTADQKVNFLVDAGYGFGWNKSRDFLFGDSYTYRVHNFSAMTGPAFFLNEHTALELTVGYTWSSRGVNVDSTASSRLKIGLGLQIHFGRGAK